MARDSIWLLQPWVLTGNKLKALVLKIIIHNTLIEPGSTNGPLFYFTHDTLITLFCYTCNIAICVCILSAQFVGIVGEKVLDCNVDWAERTSREEMIFRELNIAISFLRIRIVTHLDIICVDVIQNIFHGANCQFGLHEISSIQTINAIGSENTLLP